MKNERHNRLVDVGRRIRTTRESGGLTLHELALLSGVSSPALSLIENGKRDIRLTSLFRIAGALRVGAGDLLEERSADVPIADELAGRGYDLEDYR